MPCFKNTVIESTNLLLFHIELISQAGISCSCAFGRQITKERLDAHLACLNKTILICSAAANGCFSESVVELSGQFCTLVMLFISLLLILLLVRFSSFKEKVIKRLH